MPNDSLTEIGKQVLPTVQIYGTWFVSAIAWLILIVIFVIIAGVIAYFVILRRQYRNKIILFEKINGRWIDTGKDRAMEIVFGDLGMSILFCKKHKKYLPRPQHQSGIRKFYYRVRADGNWENFEFIDDETPDIQRFHSVEKSISERNVGIRKGLGERYKQSNWLKDHAVMLVSIGFIVIIGIMTWLLFDKWIQLAQTTNAGVEASKKVMETSNQVINKLDILLTKMGVGSGVVPSS